MSITTPRQHIVSTQGVCGGKPCIAGTRIRVWDIAVLSLGGHSPDEIIAAYPSLTLSDIHAALAYYYDHRDEIEAQAAEDMRTADALRQQLGSGPLEEKLRAAQNSTSL